MNDTGPYHEMAVMTVSRQMTPGRDYVIRDGHEWQVADCWWEERGTEVVWGGVSFGTVDGAWMIEAVRRIDNLNAYRSK